MNERDWTTTHLVERIDEYDWTTTRDDAPSLAAGYPPFYDQDATVIYQKIREGKPDYPPFFERAAKECVRRLLTVDPARRLGCRKGGGEGVVAASARDAKRHAWFAGFDFASLAARRLDAPIVVELPVGLRSSALVSSRKKRPQPPFFC